MVIFTRAELGIADGRTDGTNNEEGKREREKPIWRHKETEKLSLLFLRADTDARVRVIYAAIFPNQ